MRSKFYFDEGTLEHFNSRCYAAIRNVERGTKRATTAACEAILEQSLYEVPKDTSTLMSSGFYKVRRRTDTSAKTWAYEGIVGYGGNGDPINPKSGKPASRYMFEVHEDLSVYHKIGKAKFLEDPVREYAARHFKRNFFTYLKEALASFSK